MNMNITAEEAALLIEMSMDALYKRVRWSIGHEGRWRSLDFDLAKSYLNSLSTLHMKAWMVLRDLDHEVLPEFEQEFMIPDHVWELVDEITASESWETTPRHLHSVTLCKTCRALYQDASNEIV